MLTKEKIIYLQLKNLPMEVKVKNGFKGKNRLDCVSAYNTEKYKGIKPLMNEKGMLFVSLTEANNFIRANVHRRADYALTHNKINVTSIWNEKHSDGCTVYGYGYPNQKRTMGKKSNLINPLHPFSEDLYLFMVGENYTDIIMLIIPDGRHLQNTYYQGLLNGQFDSVIKEIEDLATPFYDYGLL